MQDIFERMQKIISEQFGVDLDAPNVRLRLLMLYRVAELADAGV